MIAAVHHAFFLSLFATLYLSLQSAVRITETYARLVGKSDKAGHDYDSVGELS